MMGSMEIGYRPGTLSDHRRRPLVFALHRREQVALLLWLPLALLLYANVQCVAVRGRSMEPTLSSGRTLLVWKLVPRGSLKPGDVIVFQAADGGEMIKRIACIRRGPLGLLPGAYAPRDGASAPVPLALLFSPYLAARDMGMIGPPSPDQTIYVVGDNFQNSYDSRDFGPISPAQILGKVLF